MINKSISICIPTYDMHGFGGDFLDFSLKKISDQTYKNFEVVISDQSTNSKVYECYLKYMNIFNIKYIKTEEKIGNSSFNINNAIKNSDGDIIKVLFQDDFFYNNNSLLKIIDSYNDNNDKVWLVSASEHTSDGVTFTRPYFPKYNDNIHLNENTISSPSVLSFRKNNTLIFDENLKWLMDVDLYKRLYIKYGEPIILNEINVVNRLWENQYNKTLPEEIKKSELEYVKNKDY
jgi:glycosyltransferase involved in cell wall biosynthesis